MPMPPKILKPRKKGAGPWPAVRILFASDSQAVFFALRELAKEAGVNPTEYARRVLVDHCARQLPRDTAGRAKVFDSLLAFGQIDLFNLAKSDKTPMKPAKKVAKKPRFSGTK